MNKRVSKLLLESNPYLSSKNNCFEGKEKIMKTLNKSKKLKKRAASCTRKTEIIYLNQNLKHSMKFLRCQFKKCVVQSNYFKKLKTAIYLNIIIELMVNFYAY